MKTHAALLFLMTSSIALADGSRLPSQDALAVARGYAYTATADDPSAIYYNPAGLGQQLSGDVEAGVSFVTPSSSYSGPAGTASTKKQTFTLPYLYAAQPVPQLGGLVFGIGVYAPFGLSTEWPQDGPFRTVATTNTLTFIRTAFSVGYDFHNGIMIGASIQDNSLKADLNRGLGYAPGDYLNYTGRDNNAWSYNAGVIWRPSPQHSFGFTYQSQTTFNLRGTVTLSPPVGISAPGTAQWLFPSNFALGYSYRPTPEWNFEIGYDQTNWSAFKTVTLNSAATGPLPLTFNWQDSAYYGAGLTRYYGSWHYSAGVNYSANSVDDSTWTPSVDDYGKWLLNGGVGFKVDSWDLETALQWSPPETRTVSGSPYSAAGQTADGTYRNTLWGLMLQAAYRW